MKYCVTIVRTGCVFVEAESVTKAFYIADHQTTDAVTWSEDWCAVDAEQDDSLPGYLCVSEPAFE